MKNVKLEYSSLRFFALFLSGVFSCLGRWDGVFFSKTVMAVGVAIPVIICFILFLKENRIHCLDFLGWYGLFFLFLLFSWTYTANIVDPEIMVRRCFFVFLIGAIISQLTRNKYDLVILMKGIIAGALLTVIVVFIVEFQFIGSDRIGKIVCGGATAFASIVLISFWCSLYLFLFTREIKYLLIICFFDIAIALTGSRMPLLISIGSIAAAYFLWAPNLFQKIKRVFFVFVFLGIFFHSLLNVPLLYDIIGYRMETMISALGSAKDLESDSSIKTRTAMKEEAILLWKSAPLLGHGVNSFWFLSPVVAGRSTSHCGFTEILCSFGLVGFVLYYWHWFWIIISKAWLNIKTRNKEPSLFAVIATMLFVMEWQTTSFQLATTVAFLGVLFKILKGPKQFGF